MGPGYCLLVPDQTKVTDKLLQFIWLYSNAKNIYIFYQCSVF